MGIISNIVHKQGDQLRALPIAVIVKFDSTYIVPSFLSDIPWCVRIISETSESDLYDFSHETQRIHLNLAWAITLHKSQGLTLDKTRVDIGKSEQFTGLTYVGLSWRLDCWIHASREATKYKIKIPLLCTELWKKSVLINYQ